MSENPTARRLLERVGDELHQLTLAVLTLATVHRNNRVAEDFDVSAEYVAHIRHEVEIAVATWASPPDSYRAENLPRG